MGTKLLVNGVYVWPYTPDLWGVLGCWRGRKRIGWRIPKFYGAPSMWRPCVPFGAQAPIKHALQSRGACSCPALKQDSRVKPAIA